MCEKFISKSSESSSANDLPGKPGHLLCQLRDNHLFIAILQTTVDIISKRIQQLLQAKRSFPIKNPYLFIVLKQFQDLPKELFNVLANLNLNRFDTNPFFKTVSSPCTCTSLARRPRNDDTKQASPDPCETIPNVNTVTTFADIMVLIKWLDARAIR